MLLYANYVDCNKAPLLFRVTHMTELDTAITSKRLPKLAERAATRLLNYPWKIWFWGDSIGIEGLLAAAELTGSAHFASYAHGLFKGWVAREVPRGRFDYTAPGVALLDVYQRTQDGALFEAALRLARYWTSFRRSQSGAFIRDESDAAGFPPDLPDDLPERSNLLQCSKSVPDQGPFVFVDSVHFDGPFFAKLYEITGDVVYLEAALDNIVPQIELLFDDGPGLFHHYWSEHSRCRNGVLWARGNGWGILGLVRTLEHVPKDHPKYNYLRSVLDRVSRGLIKAMDPCGGWHTVLDDSSSYIETSAGAFFIDAFSSAASAGLIDPCLVSDTVIRALDFLLENVQDDGTLDGVSHDTFPSTLRSDYANLPRGAITPWGQGPLLTAMLSYSRFTRMHASDYSKGT
jgi:unsaturated rhamnogalacturonyl hydrolase